MRRPRMRFGEIARRKRILAFKKSSADSPGSSHGGTTAYGGGTRYLAAKGFGGGV